MKSLIFICVIQCSHGFSGGAPAAVCDDMRPIHLAPPQRTKMPYNITINKNEINAGENIEILIGGGKFKGLMMEVRKDQHAVGQFVLSDNNNDFKIVNCHNSKKSGITHKNNRNKKDKKVVWKSPKTPGEYKVYATIAQDGFVFWVKQPTAVIKIV